MINLLLSGVAVSNVFDGQIELDSGGSKKVRHNTMKVFSSCFNPTMYCCLVKTQT